MICVSYLLVGWSSGDSCLVPYMYSDVSCLNTVLPLHAYSQAPFYTAPLQVAAGNGHVQIVERLLKGGANINYQVEVRST